MKPYASSMDHQIHRGLNAKRVIILGCTGDTTKIIYNYLNLEVPIHRVFIEKSRSRMQIIRQKLRRFGCLSTIGQMLFAFTARNLLEAISKQRKSAIKAMPGMDLAGIPAAKRIQIESVNSNTFRKQLSKLKPDLVIVSGTRIISKKTLTCIDAPFVNIHPGITPAFRGLCTGYWAMVINPQDVGVTVHLIDPGVDTGAVLSQVAITPLKQDNLATVSILQIQAGLPLLLQAVKDLLEGCAEIKPPISSCPSRQWTYPTLWGYLWNLVRFGVK